MKDRLKTQKSVVPLVMGLLTGKFKYRLVI